MGTATLQSNGQYSCTGKASFLPHPGTQRSETTTFQVTSFQGSGEWGLGCCSGIWSLEASSSPAGPECWANHTALRCPPRCPNAHPHGAHLEPREGGGCPGPWKHPEPAQPLSPRDPGPDPALWRPDDRQDPLALVLAVWGTAERWVLGNKDSVPWDTGLWPGTCPNLHPCPWGLRTQNSGVPAEPGPASPQSCSHLRTSAVRGARRP